MTKTVAERRARLEFLEVKGAEITLIILLEKGEQAYSDLKNITGIPTHTLNHILRKLEEHNIIEETREKEFPRRRLIRLTKKGMQVAKKLAEIENILSEE